MTNSPRSIRIGSAIFNADHGNLAAELKRVEAAGIDFLHFDIFDGHFVADLAFPPRTMQTLRSLTSLPFEVHLAANDPLRFLPALLKSGANLVFLPAESTPLLYEAIFSVREQGLKVGLCLALGTPLHVLEPVLPLLDAILLLGRVTGEGSRGRTFNDLLLPRIQSVRSMVDAGTYSIDVQAAGGLETAACRAVVEAGASSLPLGAALHREADLAAYLGYLRTTLEPPPSLIKISPLSSATSHHQAAANSHTSPYRVLVASRSFGPNCPEAVERLHKIGCELLPNIWGRAPSERELLSQVADIDVLISGTEPVTSAVIAAAKNLKVIAKHGVGYENIDLNAARERGIPIAVVGGAIVDSVADMTMALLLGAVRQLPQGDASVKQGQWRRFVGSELRAKTLGIIGLGQIGKAVCRRARGFGLNLVAYDTFHDDVFARSWGVQYLPLPDLLAVSDIITLHSPVTAETHHLINAATLSLVKPDAYLINTARGELIDEVALEAALRQGRLAGAAIDVLQKEPPGSHPLLTFDNVIIMPHSAGQTTEGLRRMGEVTVDNIIRVLYGGKPLYQVI